MYRESIIKKHKKRESDCEILYEYYHEKKTLFGIVISETKSEYENELISVAKSTGFKTKNNDK